MLAAVLASTLVLAKQLLSRVRLLPKQLSWQHLVGQLLVLLLMLLLLLLLQCQMMSYIVPLLSTKLVVWLSEVADGLTPAGTPAQPPACILGCKTTLPIKVVATLQAMCKYAVPLRVTTTMQLHAI